MNSKLEKLLGKREYEKLDYKRDWYKQDKNSKKEMVKDIIGLANGNPYNVGEDAFLIIGVKEKSGGKQEFYNVDLEMDVSELKREVLQSVNNYADPPINKLNMDIVEYKENNLLILSIPQHSYLIKLKKDLRSPAYREKDVIYRVGESTQRACLETCISFKESLSRFNKEKNKLTKNNTPVIIELNQDHLFSGTNEELRSIVRNIVFILREKKELKINTIVKDYIETEAELDSLVNKKKLSEKEEIRRNDLQLYLQQRKKKLELVNSMIYSFSSSNLFVPFYFNTTELAEIFESIFTLVSGFIFSRNNTYKTKFDIWIESNKTVFSSIRVSEKDVKSILVNFKVDSVQSLATGIDHAIFHVKDLPREIITKYVIAEITLSLLTEINAGRLSKKESIDYYYYHYWLIGLG